MSAVAASNTLGLLFLAGFERESVLGRSADTDGRAESGIPDMLPELDFQDFRIDLRTLAFLSCGGADGDGERLPSDSGATGCGVDEPLPR